MEIKVCGMRNSENITELVKLSPDYMGFIFYGKSKRFVTDFPKVVIPNSIKKVGVFVNETIENILQKITEFNLAAVQLHGDETSEFCKKLKEIVTSDKTFMLTKNNTIQIFKAFSVDEDFDFSKTKEYESFCDLFLFDTKGNDYGGNGIKYDWSILQNYTGNIPFLLSGGITYKDAHLVNKFQHSKCVGVDLNSGFEESPALKNIDKLKLFKSELLFNNTTVLKSEKVTLRILQKEDLESLYKVSQDEALFEYFPLILSKKDDLKKWISNRLVDFKNRTWLPFVIINNATNSIIGTTSFIAISAHHKRVEIGSTWLGKQFQGKGFNKPSKYLLLKYGFENPDLERIELKTDLLNIQSQKAIQKIGVTQEGVFRNHMTMPKNRRRDTVYFSIIKNEWEEIKHKIFIDVRK